MTSQIYVPLFDFYFSHGLVRVCEIELSHMNKNNGNPDLVCDKYLYLMNWLICSLFMLNSSVKEIYIIFVKLFTQINIKFW